jgi:beta-galactosidase
MSLAAASAQPPTAVVPTGTAPLRTEFISYATRDIAEKGDLAKNAFYVPLTFDRTNTDSGKNLSATIDIPYLWLDRDVFLHVGGATAFNLYVNGRQAGYADDARTPHEFNVSQYLTDGGNTLMLEIFDHAAAAELDGNVGFVPEPEAYIYSQPKLRIEDYTITAEPDSTAKHGILTVTLALANSYNTPGTITVGYDIYSPQGKLQYYDMREVTIAGGGRDTVTFVEPIYGVMQNLWSAEKPSLYRGMLTVKQDTRMTEYIPYTVGFGTTEVSGGTILRNGKPITIKAVTYDVATPDPKKVAEHIAMFRKSGYNTIYTDYPQPMSFYEACNRTGMYVIDRANINSSADGGNRRVGGALTNNPQWLAALLYRTEAMYARAKNMTCIIGRSLGGNSGNGYNMYKTYNLLKQLAPRCAVIYNDAAGEWNSDLTLPSAAEDGTRMVLKPVLLNSKNKR